MKTNKLLLVALITLGTLHAAKPYKKYLVPNGTVLYQISGSGNIMGQKMALSGKKRIFFDHYGYNEMTEEVSVQKMIIMGQKKIDKTHKLTLMQGMAFKTVDFHHHKIYIKSLPGMALFTAASNQNIAKMGEKMLKQMGGRKTGTDTVLGYTCDIWKMRIATQCIYRGVPLWVKSNVMGMSRTEKAIEATFDNGTRVDPSKLPKYPVVDLGGGASGGGISAEDMAALGKALQAGAAARKQAGIQPGQRVTPSQKQKLEDAMMHAMLPAMKQRVRKERKKVVNIRRCIVGANTLTQLRHCTIRGQEDDMPSVWNETEKQKILRDIDRGLKSMDCILKANTGTQVEQCGLR